MKLPDLLIREGLASREAVDAAIEHADDPDRPLVALLVDEGVVAEDALADLLARELFTVVIDLDQGTLDLDSVRLLPQHIAGRHLVVPVAPDPSGESLRVAFANPLDEEAVESVRELTGLGVQPLVATVSGLRHAIAREYEYHRDTSMMPPPATMRAVSEMPPEITRRVESVEEEDEGDVSGVMGTVPLHRIEHEATVEQRLEALVLALVESGAITRADYIGALRRLMDTGRDES